MPCPICPSGASFAPAKMHSDHFCQEVRSLPAEPPQGPRPHLDLHLPPALPFFNWFQSWVPPYHDAHKIFLRFVSFGTLQLLPSGTCLVDPTIFHTRSRASRTRLPLLLQHHFVDREFEIQRSVLPKVTQLVSDSAEILI